MTARPILMHARSIQNLLAGRKTQTRRIITPEWARCLDLSERIDRIHARDKCRYGRPGDLLWVREACAEPTSLDPGPTFYRANYPACVPKHFENVPPADEVRWKPSIHMRRNQSRLTLRLTDVRVEQVQEINVDDVLAEGVDCPRHARGPCNDSCGELGEDFRALWNDTNGPGAWDRNDWVWALHFEVLRQNVDTVLQRQVTA